MSEQTTATVKLVEDIGAKLTTMYPALYERLNVGATEEQINDFEGDMGLSLPSYIRKMYKMHNGESEYSSIFGGWRWLPLSGIKEQIENFLLLERDGYAYGFDIHTAIPIFSGDFGILYVKRAEENSPVFFRDDDYPERQDLMCETLSGFFLGFLDALNAEAFNYSERAARAGNTYVHLYSKDGKPWPK